MYKHFAILGPESNRSAEASECAAEQGQFWAFHDRVFADQTTSRSTLSAGRLAELAADIGLDPAAFSECLDSGRYSAQITQESLSVQSLGVRGTPAFLINGTFVSGAQPFEVFQQIIEEQLAQLPAAVSAAPKATAFPSPTPAGPADVEPAIEGVIIFPDPGLDHQDGTIPYPQPLPAGGAHSDAWQNCGIYTEPVPVEPVVHSLEHGAVWIAYRPDLPDEQVEQLREKVRQERQSRGEARLLLAPMPANSPMDAPIVLTAWRVQLQLSDASDARLAQFLQTYQNGPFTPEPGAPCRGGVGEPVE